MAAHAKSILISVQRPSNTYLHIFGGSLLIKGPLNSQAETSRLVDLAGDNGPRMKDMEEEGEVEDEVEGEVGKAEVEEDAGGEKE